MGTLTRHTEPELQPWASDRAVAKGMVRVGTLMYLPDLLREHGIDVERTLAEVGLDESYLGDPENTYPYPILGLLARRCAELMQCPHFGLLSGQRMNASALGTVGLLAQSAPNVRAALHALSRHLHLHNPNAAIELSELTEEKSLASLRFTLMMPHMAGWEHILDGALALACNTMSKLCGEDWKVSQVRFAHARPVELAPFRDFFNAELRFDAQETALLFENAWLDHRVATADPALHLTMARRAREVELREAEDLVSQVRRMLPSLVATRTGSVGVVASLLGLSVRTLNRRLAEEGTTFMRLRDEARHTVACQLLQNTRIPANEIAERLGYANPSAFTRAFERWAGTGPTKWRTAHAAARTATAHQR